MARYAIAPSRRLALSAQIAAEASHAHEHHGPDIGWQQLLTLLQDTNCVRFPCELRFDSAPLLPGEFGYAVRKGSKPEEGYLIYLHPLFEHQLEQVPYLVLYQLVFVNHGDAASADDAETFGAIALGLSRDEYVDILCELSGQIGGDDLL